MITVSQIQQLPLFHTAIVEEAHLDEMGHMNIQWYLSFFDKAGWQFFSSVGLTPTYFKQTQNGIFSLQQYIYYYAEVRLGETVNIYTRLLGLTAKRAHFMHFMLNQSRPGLSATLETLASHVDLEIRRTSAFPGSIGAPLDTLLRQQQTLTWQAPICGVMQA